MSLDLSIIILSYKSKADLGVLLPSVFASEYRYSYEVIVVDNDSGDGTAEFVEQFAASKLAGFRNNQPISLKVFRNKNNGFAAGNNLGIKQAVGRYVLLLNPDTKLAPDTLELMLEFMERRPDVGIGGCKLLKGNGQLDLACRRRFPNPWNAFQRLFLKNNTDYNYTNLSPDLEMEVESVVGAFLLIRKSVIEKIGLLDEQFFMYGEDLDWCWRCKQAGFKVWYYPKAQALHLKGQSSGKIPFKALRWFHEAMWVFYKKHYQKQYPWLLNALIFCGIYLRLGCIMVINFFKDSPRVSV